MNLSSELRLRRLEEFFTAPIPLSIDFDAIRAACAEEYEQAAQRERETWSVLGGQVIGVEEP